MNVPSEWNWDKHKQTYIYLYYGTWTSKFFQTQTGFVLNIQEIVKFEQYK